MNVRNQYLKGVNQTAIEGTVDAAITDTAKKAPGKKSAAPEGNDLDAERLTSKPPTMKLKKLPGKTKPPSLTLKSGKKS